MAQRLIASPVVEATVGGLRERVAALRKLSITPSLKVILVGNHAPSLLYTRNKKKFCEKIGAECEIIHLDSQIDCQELISVIERCNRNSKAHGCFVQLPLPPHLGQVPVDQLVFPEKDVDGLHAQTIGKIYRGVDEQSVMAPCTPKGILKLLGHYGIDIAGKNVTIIGRGHVVGRPLALMMTNRDATVSLCHSRSMGIKELTTSSDIIVSAVGCPGFLDRSFIGPGRPVVIDVGINKVDERLCGDVNFDEIQELCSAITPVPGGVGPMTILTLAENLILAAEEQGRHGV